MTLPPNTRVIILTSRVADAAGQHGTIEREHEGGYAVRIETQQRTVWCERDDVVRENEQRLDLGTP